MGSPIVGCQNKGFENSGYTIVANTFLPVGGSTDAMTLEDFKVNDAFINSILVFMTTGGANAKTTWNGKNVNKSTMGESAQSPTKQGAWRRWICRRSAVMCSSGGQS